MDFIGGAVDVGLRVAALREQRGWTYRDLAEKTEKAGRRVSTSVLYRIEKGAQEGHPQKVSLDDFVALCRVFDVSPDDMLTSADEIDRREAQRLSAELSKAFDACLRGAQRVYDLGAELEEIRTRDRGRGADVVTASFYQFQPDVTSSSLHPYVLNEIANPLVELVRVAQFNSMIERDRTSLRTHLRTDITTITDVEELYEFMVALDDFVEKETGQRPFLDGMPSGPQRGRGGLLPPYPSKVSMDGAES